MDGTIKDFVQLVNLKFNEGPGIRNHLANLVLVMNDFSEIKVWLSQLDGFKVETVLPTIYKCLQNGSYSSTCTKYDSLVPVIRS